MTAQQPDQSKATPKPPDGKIIDSDKPQLKPEAKSSMDKFNKALRRILSVPKNGISKK